MAKTFDVEAARARCNAAMPGPWASTDRPNDRCCWDAHVETDDHDTPVADVDGVCNAAFIAHARTDLPAALDEIERLRAAREAVDRLVKACQRTMESISDDARPEAALFYPGRAIGLAELRAALRAVEAARAK